METTSANEQQVDTIAGGGERVRVCVKKPERTNDMTQPCSNAHKRNRTTLVQAQQRSQCSQRRQTGRCRRQTNRDHEHLQRRKRAAKATMFASPQAAAAAAAAAEIEHTLDVGRGGGERAVVGCSLAVRGCPVGDHVCFHCGQGHSRGVDNEASSIRVRAVGSDGHSNNRSGCRGLKLGGPAVTARVSLSTTERVLWHVTARKISLLACGPDKGVR